MIPYPKALMVWYLNHRLEPPVPVRILGEGVFADGTHNYVTMDKHNVLRTVHDDWLVPSELLIHEEPDGSDL